MATHDEHYCYDLNVLASNSGPYEQAYCDHATTMVAGVAALVMSIAII